MASDSAWWCDATSGVGRSMFAPLATGIPQNHERTAKPKPKSPRLQVPNTRQTRIEPICLRSPPQHSGRKATARTPNAQGSKSASQPCRREARLQPMRQDKSHSQFKHTAKRTVATTTQDIQLVCVLSKQRKLRTTVLNPTSHITKTSLVSIGRFASCYLPKRLNRLCRLTCKSACLCPVTKNPTNMGPRYPEPPTHLNQ